MTSGTSGNGHVIRRACIVGGAGFIGSHFVERLLSDPTLEQVTVYDNFSSGRRWHLRPFETDGRLRVIDGEVDEPGAR